MQSLKKIIASITTTSQVSPAKIQGVILSAFKVSSSQEKEGAFFTLLFRGVEKENIGEGVTKVCLKQAIE